MAENPSTDVQSRSIYADQQATGERVPVSRLAGYKASGSASQMLDYYTPILSDWDKAREDAGVRPLQFEDIRAPE